MIQFPRDDRDGLETWLASQIADLASTLAPPQAGLLLLDAQMTNLENKCATAHDRSNGKTARRIATLRPAF